MFNIRCAVRGGVTGYRTSLLKGINGAVRTFETSDEAFAEANWLNDKMNGPHARAYFSYGVVLADDESGVRELEVR